MELKRNPGAANKNGGRPRTVTCNKRMDYDTNEYSDYWTEPHWVLVGPNRDNGVNSYSIIDVERHMFAIIEDWDAAQYVIKKMLSKGVKVYKSILDLPEPTIPQHWTNIAEEANFDKAVLNSGLTEKQIDKLSRVCLGKNFTEDQVRRKIKELTG